MLVERAYIFRVLLHELVVLFDQLLAFFAHQLKLFHLEVHRIQLVLFVALLFVQRVLVIDLLVALLHFLRHLILQLHALKLDLIVLLQQLRKLALSRNLLFFPLSDRLQKRRLLRQQTHHILAHLLQPIVLFVHHRQTLPVVLQQSIASRLQIVFFLLVCFDIDAPLLFLCHLIRNRLILAFLVVVVVVVILHCLRNLWLFIAVHIAIGVVVIIWFAEHIDIAVAGNDSVELLGGGTPFGEHSLMMSQDAL
mmetsp:Transcript_5370/g.8972  ORF Transcript_5370/g.8972 Transcript_5370/m.8972 type:complete len:251 (-) Transcript_5370:1235-1987(-)